MRYPVIKFQAGTGGTPFDNVNFARQQAESMAQATGAAVVLYRMVDGEYHELTVIKPKFVA
jgi:hypothetical protein